MEGIAVAIAAAVVVVVTSLFKRVDMSTKVKTFIATVVSAATALLADFASRGWSFDGYTGADILGTSVLVFGASQLIYKFIMEGTAADAALESVGDSSNNGNPDEEAIGQ